MTAVTKDLTMYLRRPVDGAPIVLFRITFGLLMFWESIVLWQDAAEVIIGPKVHFTYLWFDWVRPLPETWMYALIGALAVLSLLIAAGLWYRLSASLFCLGFSYFFLLDKSYFLNHFYLISLLSFLLILAPAHRELSFDALIRPGLRGRTVPFWTLALLQFQVAVPYVFGGIAKFDQGWLSAAPLKIWLPQRATTHPLGSLMAEPWMPYVFAYGGLLFDMLIVPLLFWKRSRTFALVLMIAFHLMNATVFTIGIFPWLMIAATFILLRPADAPVRAFWRTGVPAAAGTAGRAPRRGMAVALFVAGYVAIQVVLPFHHLLYPGDVNWTAEGSYFSWRMMIRKMEARAEFRIVDAATDETLSIILPEELLTPFQTQSFARDPDMILQLAHRIAAIMRDLGVERFAVRANVTASLNGRPVRRFIDPNVDLAAEKRGLTRKPWVLPPE